MSNINLYDSLIAYFPGRARLALIEKGIEYTSITVDVLNGESLEPSFMRLNPKSTVPVLVDGSIKLTDSLDIARYVDKVGLRLGEGEVDLKVVDEWADLIGPWNGNVHVATNMPGAVALIVSSLTNYKIKVAEARAKECPDLKAAYESKIFQMKHILTDQEKEITKNELEAILAKAETTLGLSPFLAGPAYSLADVLFTVMLFRLGVAGTITADLQQRSRVSEYYSRMQGRSSFQKAFNATYVQKAPILAVLPTIIPALMCKLFGKC